MSDEILVKDLDALRDLATSLAQEIKPPVIFLLEGDLGTGKTSLVRFLVEALGGKAVSSPSFAIHQRYQTNIGEFDHVDLYRLKDDEDLESTGFWDLLAEPNLILAVEWADRLPKDIWPKNVNLIHAHGTHKNNHRTWQIKKTPGLFG